MARPFHLMHQRNNTMWSHIEAPNPFPPNIFLTNQILLNRCHTKIGQINLFFLMSFYVLSFPLRFLFGSYILSLALNSPRRYFNLQHNFVYLFFFSFADCFPAIFSFLFIIWFPNESLIAVLFFWLRPLKGIFILFFIFMFIHSFFHFSTLEGGIFFIFFIWRSTLFSFFHFGRGSWNF